jgi:prepilin-type N-terminal cleavage/methylation domain-containing protein
MRHKPSHRGITLMESIVTMAVLTIGVAAAIGVTVDSAKSVSRSAHVEEANMLAQSLVSALMTVPWSARGSSGASLFANTSTSNDNDIVDGAGTFTNPTLPPTAYDHSETEITGTPAATLVTPLPTGRTPFQRYWNIAPIAGTNGVSIAVIVRWQEGTAWKRVVMVASRYQP